MNERLKIYYVFLDDGVNVFKIAVPAVDEASAIDYVRGNGVVISVKEDKDYRVDMNKLSCVLAEHYDIRDRLIIERIIHVVGLDCY